ncbi:substrate-binding domain-containing protein, partial [Serratia marcescens]
FNDTPLAAQLPIALSSVRSPMRDMGYRAMELLLKKMKGETPASLKLEPRLVIRESSRGVPAR